MDAAILKVDANNKKIDASQEKISYQQHIDSYVENAVWFFGRIVGMIALGAILITSLIFAPVFSPLTIMSLFGSTVLAVGIATQSERGSYLDSFAALITYWTLLLVVSALAPIIIYGLASQALISPEVFAILLSSIDLMEIATPFVALALTAIANIFLKDALIDFNRGFLKFLLNVVSLPLSGIGALAGGLVGMLTYEPSNEGTALMDTETTNSNDVNHLKISTSSETIYTKLEITPSDTDNNTNEETHENAETFTNSDGEYLIQPMNQSDSSEDDKFEQILANSSPTPSPT